MTITYNGQLIDFETPKIMGIVNITPDSFYDGGTLANQKAVFSKVENMLAEGAHFIDMGAYSSKPNAAEVTEAEEWHRLAGVLPQLVKQFPQAYFSVDTFRSGIAQKAIDCGVGMINDISAGKLDANMLPVIAQNKAVYCMMHLKGTPQNMMQQTDYKNIITDIRFYFSEQIAKAKALGIHDIIIDPGFGFSKTLSQNYELMQQLEAFQTFEKPVLVGISRKSMIYKLLETNPQEALNGSTVLHTLALQKGAHILRVHDVKAAQECVKIMQMFR